MRPEGPHDRWFQGAAAALALAASITAGAAGFGAHGALGGAALGLALAGMLQALLTRRARRRRRTLAVPFPEEWRRLLERRYPHYRRLPGAERARFEEDVRIFLDETRITGIEVESTEELRLLVAASAVTLSVGWPDFDWDAVTEVLLYPHDFGRDYTFEKGELSGQTHSWGTVILSVPSLRHSFAHPDDGYHVGLHEFAHLLDMERGQFDGLPAGLPSSRAAEWVRVMEHEMERLRSGTSAIDPYGGEQPPEFLAVAVEAFFEIPRELRRRHPELYALLRDWLGQDPARWDEAIA